MNYTNPNEIQAAFKAADSKVLWSLSQLTANAFKAQEKVIKGLEATVAKAQTNSELPAEDMTDEEISSELRQFFISRLKAKTLIPAEINAFKEILGLLDKEQSIVIQTVNYADLTDEDIEAAKAG